MEEGSSVLSTPAVAKQLVTQTFKEVWTEYYNWETVHSARVLGSLAAKKPEEPEEVSSLVLEEDYPLGPTTGGDSFGRYQVVNDEWDYNTTPNADLAVISSHILPHPPYECCTPITYNILHGDDSNFMPFVPLADDPTFDHREHAYEYKALAWQEAYRDPETLEIAVEAARRLAIGGLSAQQIDDTAVLPLTLRTTSTWGAVWNAKQSDAIDWPGSSRALCSIPDVSPPPADNLRLRLQDYLTLCCRRPDCLQANCFSHSMQQAVIDYSGHRYRGEEPFRCLPAQNICGHACTLRREAVSEQDVLWSAQDLDDLRVIAHLGTPMTPCDLAILCHKPCYEVAFLCRKHDNFYAPPKRHIGDPEVDTASQQGYGSQTTSDLIRDPSCDHPGPCRPDTGCACFKNQSLCTRMCRCSRNCARRRTGCRCAMTTTKASKTLGVRLCGGTHCSCRSAKRECDPEVCACCNTGGLCRNAQIQRQQHKRVQVKTGNYGLGLFILESARADDLITEYVGELIFEPTFVCRGQVADHVGRSYVFGLNDVLSVDATNAGNVSRYINHAPTRQANVKAIILAVNGDQRIGIFAKKNIPAGAELFMDYGPEYPVGDKPTK
ncbi:SET domain-containing protein [Cubamyces sp. BRFM 1775]|nr:SET domain-containing protein [Cubamyces sp. BRFM 1775]